MMKKLSPLGFREVHLEELSFYYHINIFYHAEIVLASHGAALTNAIFAGEKTNIVEIKIGNQPHFIDICNKMGISHRNIGTEILYNTDKEENGYIKVDELANYIITNFGTPKPYILHYVIHNDDPTRREKMTAEFEKCGIPDVKWMIYPNRKDFTPEFRQKYIRDNVVHYNGENICSVGFFNDQCGLVSCTYKHYAALKDAVENNCDYCLVMEDNSTFDKDVYKLTLEKYIPQLNELYGNEWDGFFNLENNEWGVYEENPVVDGIYVYPKSNARARSEGSTKAGRYYIFKRDFAKRVVDAYLPIYAAPDAQMNFIFRNLNARMFWIQPPTVFNDPTHISCAYKEN
jgi:GR25 family glycosyltransferase involved in LPS biosynthesis